MPSLPGYGNSDNPSENYYKTNNFDNEAEVINQLIDKIEKTENGKVHLIGHSMGSEIMATVAEKYPQKVSSLVLLNPAGVNKEDKETSLIKRFLNSEVKTSGEYAMRSTFSGEKDYEKELYRYIPETQGPLSEKRIPQRLSEIKRLSEGHLLDKLEGLECPIIYISGELDKVYPPGKESDENSQLARVIKAIESKSRIEKSRICYRWKSSAL